MLRSLPQGVSAHGGSRAWSRTERMLSTHREPRDRVADLDPEAELLRTLGRRHLDTWVGPDLDRRRRGLPSADSFSVYVPGTTSGPFSGSPVSIFARLILWRPPT